ncbi:unknown [Ruminococcus sp. CAG:353]|nr:unknown [Ruminococcus sp. CAG:353]
MIIMKRSCKFSCIIAAMCHTLGQLAAACVLTGSVYTLAYVVVLMPVSIFTGFLTGTVLQALQGFLDDRKVVK